MFLRSCKVVKLTFAIIEKYVVCANKSPSIAFRRIPINGSRESQYSINILTA